MTRLRHRAVLLLAALVPAAVVAAAVPGTVSGWASAPGPFRATTASGPGGASWECAAVRRSLLSRGGLRSAWPLSDPAGSASVPDLGPQTATGVPEGPVVFGVGGPRLADAGTAARFDGTARIGFGDVHDLAGSAPFTVAAWVRADPAQVAAGGTARVLAKESAVGTGATTDGWALTVDNGFPAFHRFVGGTERSVRAAASIADGRWHHLAATGTQIHVDGAVSATDAALLDLALLDTSAPLLIGGRSGRGFVGDIAGVGVYDRTLSTTDVQVLAAGTCGYQAVVDNTPGLVGFWGLGDRPGTTTAANRVSGAAAGTHMAEPVLGERGGLPSTLATGARYGTNAAQRTRVGDVHDFAGTTPFTAELWARRDGAGVGTSAPHLMSKQTATSPAGWALRAGADDRWSCSRADLATLTAAVSPDPVLRNRWTHVACTYDGGALRLYLNGTEVAAVTDLALLPDTTTTLTIGSSPGGSLGWAGALDEAAVYDRALSAAEIAQHWAAR